MARICGKSRGFFLTYVNEYILNKLEYGTNIRFALAKVIEFTQSHRPEEAILNE